MSLPSYLANIKSSGIYRFVWDKSEVANVDAETLRLVVGYSEIGPFNTPVYIDSKTKFTNIFGGINKKLERYGVYFHRMALQALDAGPIIALNLKKFATETVETAQLDSNTNMFNESGEIIQHVLLRDIYDTTRFWKLSPEQMQEATEHQSEATTSYITIGATDDKSASRSIFVRGYTPSGMNITVRDYYNTQSGSESMPDFLEGYEDRLIQDFWLNVYVFAGEFTQPVATSKELCKYFDVVDGNVYLKPYLLNAYGEKIDTLDTLAKDPNSGFINNYIGCTIPEFKNNNNAYQSLDIVFNADNDTHKLMMCFNKDALYNETISVDSLMTDGWVKAGLWMIDDTTNKFQLFSNSNVTPEVAEIEWDDVNGAWREAAENADNIYNDLIKYQLPSDSVADLPNRYGQMGLQVGDRFLSFDITGEDPDNNPIYAPNVTTLTEIKEVTSVDEVATPTVGDVTANQQRIQNSTPTEAGKIAVLNNSIGENMYVSTNVKVETAGTYTPTINVLLDGEIPTTGDIMVYEIDDIEHPSTLSSRTLTNGEGTLASITTSSANETVNTYLVVESKKVGTITITVEVTTGATATGSFEPLPRYSFVFSDMPYSTYEKSSKYYLVKCNHICSEGISEHSMMPTYLVGYTKENAKPVDNTMYEKLQWQNGILQVLSDERGLRTGLTSRNDIDYRYIVDTFESFPDNELKSRITAIAKEKDNAVALVNFPSVQTFRKCEYVSFTDAAGVFQTKFIATGGNPYKTRFVYFSLPSENNGASFASFNTPIKITDGTLTHIVPSAAVVSNKFMEKYSGRQPYYIVAGLNYGRITTTGLVGPDFNYAREDLDILEPMGVNAMVYVPRQGTYINSNQTAKQTPVTALSKLNIRELVIYLQDEIEKLLRNYQWEFNTQALRDTIKSKADTICENIKANGGIYDYYNLCNTQNNTPEVIDNEMFVLSTTIEPSKGCGKMVQELTITRTGGISSVTIQ